MLDSVSSAAPTWASRNVQVLRVFGPLLVLTAILGFVVPARLALMSGATPYNLFHLLAGAVAIAIVARGSAAAASTFNLIFGCIDLYQALAGVIGLFPAQLFALRPADHVVHVVVGSFLAGVGYLGKRSA